MGDPFLAWLQLAQRLGAAAGPVPSGRAPRAEPKPDPPAWHELDPADLCAIPRSVPGRALIVYPARMPDGSTLIELAEWPTLAYLGPLDVAEQIAREEAYPLRLSVFL